MYKSCVIDRAICAAQGIPGWSAFYHMDQNQDINRVSDSKFAELVAAFPDLVPDDKRNTQLTQLFTV
jgi:lysophospholipase L1-like esterase